ncbi:MAG TPA: DUF3043 domain-containing protein [Nocardioides sp.]|uniref:DUF3043 domain-containing protein n=1 Tax=Nocardioides sp. TaxID=35761 RepID=UPI002F3F5EDC
MFRRTKPESAATEHPETDVPSARQKKGRPTPSRRDAEAANKAKAKVPRTRKEQAAARRLARGESTAKMREAMRTGDDRYLPARDRGPVRRFVRDFVDSSFWILELMLPILVVLLIFGYSGSAALAGYANVAMPALILLILVESFRIRWRLSKELNRRFPDQSHKGTTFYAVMRALQVRPFRQPKPQVKMGQQLPEHYR